MIKANAALQRHVEELRAGLEVKWREDDDDEDGEEDPNNDVIAQIQLVESLLEMHHAVVETRSAMVSRIRANLRGEEALDSLELSEYVLVWGEAPLLDAATAEEHRRRLKLLTSDGTQT